MALHATKREKIILDIITSACVYFCIFTELNGKIPVVVVTVVAVARCHHIMQPSPHVPDSHRAILVVEKFFVVVYKSCTVIIIITVVVGLVTSLTMFAVILFLLFFHYTSSPTFSTPFFLLPTHLSRHFATIALPPQPYHKSWQQMFSLVAWQVENVSCYMPLIPHEMNTKPCHAKPSQVLATWVKTNKKFNVKNEEKRVVHQLVLTTK